MQLFTCTGINNNKIVNVGTCLYISTLENLRFKTCMGTPTCVITTRTRFCNLSVEISELVGHKHIHKLMQFRDLYLFNLFQVNGNIFLLSLHANEV